MVMNADGVTEYLGNFDDYIEKRDRPMPPTASAGPEVTKTAIIRERKRDRKQSAHIRELKALVKKAEEAIEANEQRIAELEAVLADPATYEDNEKALRVGEEYRAEQEKTDALYEALEAAEMAVEEAEQE